jgi:hypothetical protein
MPREAREQNEALFREVNERIDEVSTSFFANEEHQEFLCECDDETCTESISATHGEYEAVRAVATHFLVLPGHQDPDVEHVVARNERFLVVEKEGQTGHNAEESNPRET